MRKLTGTEVAFVHVDGHNWPAVHIFASLEAAHAHIEPEYLDGETDEVLMDANGDSWFQVTGDLPEVDHTR